MTEKQQNIFFAVIRKALWMRQQRDDEALLEDIEAEKDWKPILRAYYDHRILSIVVSAIKNLPVGLQPSEKQYTSIDCYIFKTWQQRIDMHNAIVSIFTTLETAGCRPVLLKGEGLAALYPEEGKRCVGDIDVFVGMHDFVKACIAVDSLNGVTHETSYYYSDSEHHYETNLGDTSVEIHYCIADDNVEYLGKKMNKWAERELQGAGFRHIEINGKDILLPPVDFDMFYIFQHLAKHVLQDGGGLRQLIDWALYLHCVHTQHWQYDKDELYDVLKRFDHLRPWQILSGVLHYQLGLPKEEIPFYDDRMARKSQGAILENIVNEGNFGWAAMSEESDKPRSALKRAFAVFHGKYQDYQRKKLLFPKSAPRKLYQGIIISLKLHLGLLPDKEVNTGA